MVKSVLIQKVWLTASMIFTLNVAGNLVKILPQSQGLCTTYSDFLKNFYNDKGVKPNCFSMSPITSDFVYKQLCAFNPTKSTVLDEIPARFLRDAAVVIEDHLTHIINLSITSSSVPKISKLLVLNHFSRKMIGLMLVRVITDLLVYWVSLQRFLKGLPMSSLRAV